MDHHAMTKKNGPTTPDLEAPRVLPAPTDDDHNDRLRACFAELKDVLDRHRCQIVPGFDQPVPVGTSGTTMQLTAVWSLAARA
jgi:hypothetical protein